MSDEILTMPYRLGAAAAGRRLGLIVLRADETLECEARQVLPNDAGLYVSRVESAAAVSEKTLAQMAHDLPQAAKLLPPLHFDVVGYGCTSGAAVIGAARVDALIGAGCAAAVITQPIRALVDACRHLQISRLAMLSPYVAEVSAALRQTLAAAGVQTPHFASFDEAEEANVARIDGESVRAAAIDLYRRAAGDVEAIFISCTNLQTFHVIADIEAECDCVVLSSNAVLLWRMLLAVEMRSTGAVQSRLLMGL